MAGLQISFWNTIKLITIIFYAAGVFHCRLNDSIKLEGLIMFEKSSLVKYLRELLENTKQLSVLCSNDASTQAIKNVVVKENAFDSKSSCCTGAGSRDPIHSTSFSS
jgi:hypothetical protein